MGTISTLAQKVNWNVQQGLSEINTRAQGVFEAIVGGLGASVSGILQGDTVGINEAEIPNMQTAIRTYVDDLEAHLANVRTNAETSGAFKGDYAVAIKGFVEAITVACGCIISQLLEFNEKLQAVYNAYKAKDTQMSSDIKGQSDELQGQFQRYTEPNSQ